MVDFFRKHNCFWSGQCQIRTPYPKSSVPEKKWGETKKHRGVHQIVTYLQSRRPSHSGCFQIHPVGSARHSPDEKFHLKKPTFLETSFGGYPWYNFHVFLGSQEKFRQQLLPKERIWQKPRATTTTTQKNERIEPEVMLMVWFRWFSFFQGVKTSQVPAVKTMSSCHGPPGTQDSKVSTSSF